MKTESGNCYETAGNYMVERCALGRSCKLTLVHAEVTGQGPLDGLKYGHAFILDGDIVIDKSNGLNIEMPKQVYYLIGGIGANVYEYSFEDFRQKIMEYKHWGPWDLETESGY